MKKYALLLLLVSLVTLFFLVRPNTKAVHKKTSDSKPMEPALALVGETLSYDVYCKGLKLGQSTLVFNGLENIDKKETYHITFKTEIPAFQDTEEIYADKETFLPYRVFREIKKLGGFKTYIEERYDQSGYEVSIDKKGTIFSKNFSIKKASPINNAILLPYYYRINGLPENGKKLKVTLPTIEFEVFLRGEEIIETPMGKMPALAFGSKPSKFTFWLSSDEMKIPVKIEDDTALNYSLVIKDMDKK
jgi:hypothetical protein